MFFKYHRLHIWFINHRIDDSKLNFWEFSRNFFYRG